MGSRLRSWLFESKTLCWLPVRLGTIIASLLLILMSGLFSALIWTAVASTDVFDMSIRAKASFISAGSLAAVIFLASIYGFIGVANEKQRVLVAYARILYVHLVLNLGITGWFLWTVITTMTTEIVMACREPAPSRPVRIQCQPFATWTKGLCIGLASAVILVELYCVMVLTRHVNSLKKAMGDTMRPSRSMGSVSDVRLLPSAMRSQNAEVEAGLLPRSSESTPPAEFDPYQELARRNGSSVSVIPRLDPEQGYGGGRWTYEDIARREKQRLRDEERAREGVAVGQSSGPWVTRSMQGISEVGDLPPRLPPIQMLDDPQEEDSLPRYNFDKDHGAGV